MTNPLLAQKQDSTTWHTGINLIDDAAGVYDAVESGSWIEGGISALGAGMDLLTVAMNPVGTLISYGLNWLIEHVKPLKDALDQLAGDADQIAAYSQTWANIGKAVAEAAKNLTDASTRDTANWTGPAADAYRQHVGGKINGLSTAVTCANAISTVVKVVGVITGVVRGLVRDMVTQAVGDFIQDALEEVFTLGLGTPVVVAQVVEQVAAWTEKIGATIKKLINSVEKLRPLMSKLEEIWRGVQKIMSELHGHGGGEPHVPHGEGGGTHVSSAEPHTSAGEHAPPPKETTGGETHVSQADDVAGGSHTEPSGSEHGGDTRTSGADDSISGNNKEPGANSKPEEGTPKCGDPIDVSTGVMIQTETDVELAAALALVITRTHKSSYRSGRWFGPTWASTVDQRIEVDDHAVHFAAADGMLLRYPHPAPGAPVLPVEGAPWPLAVDEDGCYRITDQQGERTLHFAAVAGDRRPLSAITDRHGNRIDFDHDSGVLVAIRHSGGYHVDVVTSDGLVTALTLRDPASANAVPLMRYRYDDRRRLVEVVNSSHLPMLFEYDDDGRITRKQDRNGMWYRYVYDADGRCVRGEGRDGMLNYTFDYDSVNRLTRATDSLGNTTVFHLNERFQVISETNPLGQAVTFEWDLHHRLLARTDALGRTTRYVHDRAGNLVELVRPDGTVARSEYDDRGRPLVVVEPTGAVWRHEYDAAGHLAATTDPMGGRTSYEYDARGNRIATTDALGNVTRVDYNAAGLPVAMTDPSGAVTRYARDLFGRLTTVTGPTGAVTSFTWTVEGKPLTRTLPDGTVERWSYDAMGNLVERVDAAGLAVRTEVGAFSRPVSRTGQDGARTTFRYDTELRLVAVTNPLGAAWTYEYDAAGRLVRETDFNGRVLTYEHDAAGRLVARLEGDGAGTRFERDALGNVVTQRTNDVVTRFVRDANGRLVAADNGDSELRIELDPLGRVVAETCDGATVSSEYDVLGRRTQRRTPSGSISTWEFAGHRLAAMRTAGQTVRFDHDLAGREVERRFGSGVRLTHEWDDNERLRSQTLTSGGGSLAQRRDYGYRPDGIVDAITDRISGARRYELDPVGRVTAVHASGWTERYAYDAAGNLAAAGWPAHDEPDTAGAREFTGTLLRRAGNVRFEHDARGRLVLRQRKRPSAKPDTWRYLWDGADRLAAVVTPDGVRWRYRYDPLGRRVAKEQLAADGHTVVQRVRFVWDGVVLAEQVVTDASGTHGTTWEWEPGHVRPISQVEREPARDGRQEWFDRRFYAIVTDLAGTPTELVDTRGDVVWHARTTLWGMAMSGPAHTPLRFPGQYHDPESGLNYSVFRYYDPTTGRFASSDPLGLGGGPDNLAYVFNPLHRVDVLGLAGSEDCATGALKKLDDEAREKILYRTNAVDKKGRPFGSPGNPNPPSIETFNPRFEDIRAGDLESHINSRMHGLYDEQVSSVSQLHSDDLVRWRPEDPISATRGADGLALTGGHHRTADIIQRVTSGTLDPNTIVRILVHD
ncbi:DUF6531 domain-containing protein [Lentzea sp. NPDC005914]|uniref:DUF6531 domain-containing protein n=1 Tax=Lentzea sp. NPDC005914 TaxID=3154572 RepID=UPI0033D89576